jgi:hypothetical protein
MTAEPAAVPTVPADTEGPDLLPLPDASQAVPDQMAHGGDDGPTESRLEQPTIHARDPADTPTPEVKIDIGRVRPAAQAVLRNLGALKHAGLAGHAEDAVVAHALALALGIDDGHVSDARAPFHANKLRTHLASVVGPVATDLLGRLDDALQQP